MTHEPHRGPLAGLRVVEMVGIGPGPHAAMLLSDLGADVVRIDRAGGNGTPNEVLDRGRAVIVIDIRSDDGRMQVLDAIDTADVLIEGYRPGVMERLGLGPEVTIARNPRLIYGRITGWGQDGPLAQAAAHDINYIALTGALAAIGDKDGPALPPLNLVGDFGGGSMYLVFGIMAALWERERSGRGQVVDAAIVDGVASLMAMSAGFAASGFVSMDREKSMLAGAAPFYRCYTCADGKDVSVGAVEPHFYKLLLERIGAPMELLEAQNRRATWPAHSAVLATIFASKPQATWCKLLEGTDACFAPVLPLSDGPHHPHLQARKSYLIKHGTIHPAPAPRFSRTPGVIGSTSDGAAMLATWQAERQYHKDADFNVKENAE